MLSDPLTIELAGHQVSTRQRRSRSTSVYESVYHLVPSERSEEIRVLNPVGVRIRIRSGNTLSSSVIDEEGEASDQTRSLEGQEGPGDGPLTAQSPTSIEVRVLSGPKSQQTSRRGTTFIRLSEIPDDEVSDLPFPEDLIATVPVEESKPEPVPPVPAARKAPKRVGAKQVPMFPFHKLPLPFLLQIGHALPAIRQKSSRSRDVLGDVVNISSKGSTKDSAKKLSKDASNDRCSSKPKPIRRTTSTKKALDALTSTLHRKRRRDSKDDADLLGTNEVLSNFLDPTFRNVRPYVRLPIPSASH